MAKHKPIQEFYAYFVDNLKVDKLLHYLREKKWLTLDESETLNSGQLTSRQKAEKILLLMPRKSTASFKAEDILIECAIWSGQSQLAKLLGYNDYEIQEINKKNPSATMPVNDGMIYTIVIILIVPRGPKLCINVELKLLMQNSCFCFICMKGSITL